MARVIMIADGGFGDSGKGSLVDAYAARTGAHTVVRFNGGPQALHHVVMQNGREHGFSQFGSATFRSGVKTFLSKFVLVSPTHLLEEAAKLAGLGVTDALARLSIDRECPLITPYHRAANWLRELARGDGHHGTCGMGIGETMEDVLANRNDLACARDLVDGHASLAVKVARLRKRKLAELEPIIADLSHRDDPRVKMALEVLTSDSVMERFLANAARVAKEAKIVDGSALGPILERPGTVIFEGAQGVLLDEWYGFHPYTTWSTTTFGNADFLLKRAYGVDVEKILAFRAYLTRHGAGPLPTYDSELTARLPERHNREDGWQGRFRCGWFDFVLFSYAREVCGYPANEKIAITCLDRLEGRPVRFCTRYETSGDPVDPDGWRPFSSRRDSINLERGHNLDRQARLAAHLTNCRPVYEQEKDAISFLARLGEEFGRDRFAVGSYGPTAKDKVFLRNS